MMKFTIGLALLIFTIIVGSYEYADNEDLMRAKERGLEEMQAKKERYLRIEQRSKQISEFSIPRGEDKKNTLEKMLEIGEPHFKFSFIGQARRDTAHLGIIRHTFRIEGPATFEDTLTLLEKLRDKPGFVVTRTCFNCKYNKSQKIETGQYITTIEGYLYAYDPNILS